MIPNSESLPEPLPQRIKLDRLYLWPGNPRHLTLNWDGRVADVDIRKPQVQTKCLRRVRKVDHGNHLLELIGSLGSRGLLMNPGAPIAVCSLGDGDFLIIDGNARVVALRDLLRLERWQQENAQYVEKLRAGIVVMDFGSWSDRDVRLSILGHTEHIHCARHL